MSEQIPQSNEIARLNDEFRQNIQAVMITPGVQALPDLPGLMQAVRGFDTFTPDNDPYGEHDFGSLLWHDKKTYWKIDYYDEELMCGEDPLSPDCHRLLTVLLAEEW